MTAGCQRGASRVLACGSCPWLASTTEQACAGQPGNHHTHLQVWVDAAQVRLLQLHADVLRDQVDSYHIVAPAQTGCHMMWKG